MQKGLKRKWGVDIMNITQKQLYDDYIKARKLGERG